MTKSEPAFLSAVLSLQDNAYHSTIWSKIIHHVVFSQNFDDLPYYLSQTMEPSIIHEISYVSKFPVEQIQSLSYPLEGPMKKIHWLYQNREYATPIQKLNLAYCLSSIANYHLATEILHAIPTEKLLPVQRIYFYFLSFILVNREGTSDSCDQEFTAMLDIIEKNPKIPWTVMLAVAAQSIVWHLKGGYVGEDLFNKFVSNAINIIEQLSSSLSFQENFILSVFYRAYAMIPAGKGNVAETRCLMEKAYQYANQLDPKTKLQELMKLDAIKTVLESTLKEYLYVAKDLEMAEQTGLKLIELDPNWSISYHELAEVYLQSNNLEKALIMYKKAREIGLPRITISEYMVGSCLVGLDRLEESIPHFIKTLEIDPSNISAGISGYNSALQLNHESATYFRQFIECWDKNGFLTNDMKELILNYV